MAKKNEVALVLADHALASRVGAAILKVIGDIPDSTVSASPTPAAAARRIAKASSTSAAVAAGTLALPPGPWAWLTMLPEMLAVWKIQAQMVSDIAALYGRQASLTQAQMLYCLFKHGSAQAVRDLVARVGERVLVKQASVRVLQTIAQSIGVNLTHRMIGKSLSRWLPVVGAMGAGAYAYYDTTQVARTAIELFEREGTVEMAG